MKSGDAIVLKPQAIADPGVERPAINPRFLGKPYQFFYGSGLYDEGAFRNSVIVFSNTDF
jgi:carotenoid cleavage dioxygenase-like enzyme